MAFGVLLLLSSCLDNLKEEPRPNSLLPSTLPDIQVPLSDSGTGSIDIAAANNIVGAFSIKFSAPKHGRIDTNNSGTQFWYRANPDFRGHDTASYTLVKKSNGGESIGKLIFYTSVTTCFVKAHDDYYETREAGPYLINVLTNDEMCGDTIRVASVITRGRHGIFAPHPTNGALITYAPDQLSQYQTDSTTYTICRNGLCSTAKIVVKRVDCAEYFQPKDDTVYYPAGTSRLQILKAKLLENDISCGDIDIASFVINQTTTRLTLHGVVDNDQQDERFLTCYLDSNYNDPGYFTYVVRRQGIPVNGKSAKVFVKRR